MNSNYLTGHSAEKRAAEYLRKMGYKIIELNWKTKYCEIDIVAQKGQVIHFVEVKYRRGRGQGQGLDYITARKHKKMGFAAQMWVSSNAWKNEYTLSAVGIDGDNFEFIEFLY